MQELHKKVSDEEMPPIGCMFTLSYFTVLAGSLCEGMAGTCCSLKMEREVLLKNLEKESHKKYVDVIAERLKPLDKAGRRLNSELL